MKIYNVVIDDNEKLGLTTISIVDKPAIQDNFVKFESENEYKTIKLSDDPYEHKIFGCALRAEFPILRYDKFNEPYYIVFSAETIEKMVLRYSEKKLLNNVSLYHNGKNVNGIVTTQFFIKNSDKGLSPVGFEHIEEGSLFVEMSVTNEDLWNTIINSNNLNGFSIEASVDYMLKESLSVQEPMTVDSLINLLVNEK